LLGNDKQIFVLVHVTQGYKITNACIIRYSSLQIGKALSRDEAVFSPINPNAEPGSSDWAYCSLPLSADLAKGLARKWPAIEETYTTTLKGVFLHLRAERENICQYFYDRRCVE
jgi:hypothetical protein